MAAAVDGDMHEAYEALAARAVEKLRQSQPGAQVMLRSSALHANCQCIACNGI